LTLRWGTDIVAELQPNPSASMADYIMANYIMADYIISILWQIISSAYFGARLIPTK
jgi:hypothetical protein